MLKAPPRPDPPKLQAPAQPRQGSAVSSAHPGEARLLLIRGFTSGTWEESCCPAGSAQAGSRPAPRETKAASDVRTIRAPEGRTATGEGAHPEFAPEADSPSDKGAGAPPPGPAAAPPPSLRASVRSRVCTGGGGERAPPEGGGRSGDSSQPHL